MSVQLMQLIQLIQLYNVVQCTINTIKANVALKTNK